jgi:hypothetical protein
MPGGMPGGFPGGAGAPTPDAGVDDLDWVQKW